MRLRGLKIILINKQNNKSINKAIFNLLFEKNIVDTLQSKKISNPASEY